MKLAYQCEGKEERQNLEDFLNFYEKYKKTQIDDIVYCPDQQNRNEKSPDYHLINLNIAVEIKKIVVEEWEKALRTLDSKANEITNLINDLFLQSGFEDDVKKKIVIICPDSFTKIKKRNFKSFAKLFVQKLSSDKNIFRKKGYYFEMKLITKCGGRNNKEGEKTLVFRVSSISDSNKPEVVLVVPQGALWTDKYIGQELERVVSEASAKFSSFKLSLKILLLIDYYLGDKEVYFKCLNNDLRNKLIKSNIDEIWVQFRAISDRCLGHQLLWSRD